MEAGIFSLNDCHFKEAMERKIRELEDIIAQMDRGDQKAKEELDEAKRRLQAEIDRLKAEINSLHDRHLAELEEERDGHKKVRNIC